MVVLLVVALREVHPIKKKTQIYTTKNTTSYRRNTSKTMPFIKLTTLYNISKLQLCTTTENNCTEGPKIIVLSPAPPFFFPIQIGKALIGPRLGTITPIA